MKARSSSRILIATAHLVLLATNTGCSLIGTGVGAAVDGKQQRYSTVHANDPSLSTGSEIQVRVASPGVSEEWIKVSMRASVAAH